MGTTTLIGFTGEYRDAVTAATPLGNGYRWLLDWLGRFNAQDDFSPFGPGGINPYVYCADDPINHSDPSGHMFNPEGFSLEVQAAAFEAGKKAEFRKMAQYGYDMNGYDMMPTTNTPLVLVEAQAATPANPFHQEVLYHLRAQVQGAAHPQAHVPLSEELPGSSATILYIGLVV